MSVCDAAIQVSPEAASGKLQNVGQNDSIYNESTVGEGCRVLGRLGNKLDPPAMDNPGGRRSGCRCRSQTTAAISFKT